MFQNHATSTGIPFGKNFNEDSLRDEDLEAEYPSPDEPVHPDLTQDEPDLTNPDILLSEASDGSPREKRDTVLAKGKLKDIEEFLKATETDDSDDSKGDGCEEHKHRHHHGEDGK